MRDIQVPFIELVMTIVVALVMPLFAGMWLKERWPEFASRLQPPLKRFGLAVFLLLIALAVGANAKLFVTAMGAIFILLCLYPGPSQVYDLLALRCRVFGRPERPAFCATLKPGPDMCGASRQDAMALLAALERATAP